MARNSRIVRAVYGTAATMGVYLALMLIYYEAAKPETLTTWEQIMTLCTAVFTTNAIERRIYGHGKD